MATLGKYKEEDVFKEGIFIGFFFLIVGILLLVIRAYFPNLWLLIISLVLLSISVVSLFIVFFILSFEKKRGELFHFIWNEILYLILGLPVAVICILILPISIYLLFFKGSIRYTTLFILISILSMQISSLIYSSIKLWLEFRSSGYDVPVKIDKGPIEQLLYKVPSSED